MNRIFKKKSVTLIELIISIIILGIIILAVAQLDFFSNASVVYGQRRVRLTNEASLALEHITRNLRQAIGTVINPAVTNAAIGGDVGLGFWTDTNPNFQRDNNDLKRAYRWSGPAGNSPFLLRYCAQCQNNPCANCAGPNEGPGPAGWGVLVARDVVYFGAPVTPPAIPVVPTPVALQDNFVSAEIQVCNNVNSLGTCDTSNNPQVNMQVRIQLHSYSIN
jgi:type II secretory pathway pseudopilin PulG